LKHRGAEGGQPQKIVFHSPATAALGTELPRRFIKSFTEKFFDSTETDHAPHCTNAANQSGVCERSLISFLQRWNRAEGVRQKLTNFYTLPVDG
jgi:hypothetical protein